MSQQTDLAATGIKVASALLGSKTSGSGGGGTGQDAMMAVGKMALSHYLSDRQKKKAGQKAAERGLDMEQYLQQKHSKKAKDGQSVESYLAQKQAQKKKKKAKKNKDGSSSSSDDSSSDSD